MSNENIDQNDIYSLTLKEHAHFINDFNSEQFHYTKLITTYLLFDYKHNSNYFPVTTDIKYENNEFVIKRARIYEDFYNEIDVKSFTKSIGKAFSTENIRINKEKGLFALNDDIFKREGVVISTNSILSKTVKFKLYSNAKQLLFFQNIYYSRTLSNLNYFYKDLNDSYKNKISIGKVEELNYHDIIKNII